MTRVRKLQEQKKAKYYKICMKKCKKRKKKREIEKYVKINENQRNMHFFSKIIEIYKT